MRARWRRVSSILRSDPRSSGLLLADNACSQAANPDWNPTDPFGSLYLNRMSHFSAAHGGAAGARRRIPFQPSILIDSANLSGGVEKKRDIADRAQEYDRALKQSQYAAARRRHGSGSVVLANSGEGAALVSSSTYQSTVGIAQTAVLGDSQGSVAPPAPAEIGKADLALDGGVGSELGESYVDGNAKRVMPLAAEEEEAMEDDGVLGLLAQIYGTGGPQVGRG
jgi:autophagy-related protein 9